ncbi:esterase [Sulfitobacter sp. SK012]|uniref:alpha/beta hydrolase n=1 Tax=Sulfitobacter sp. SK012 TaxID=1389005 RepID=UPI000E0A3D49|nr:alpha/beta hydrolase [Sulfitobacter sp. SK012]AXI45206.1 esterase [Sulfitobacter sp. SK012]
MTYIHTEKRAVPGAPLIFTFHGTGGDEHQFSGLAAQLIPEAGVVSPRGDVSEMGAARFFKRTGEGVYDMDDLAERVAKMGAFVQEMITDGKPSRVIGIGYSNGANILAALSFKKPDLFDDLILMHPLIPWAPKPQPSLAGKRVLITAGQRDPIGPAATTQKLADYYAAQGSATQLVWHEGGHDLRQSEIEAVASFLHPQSVSA